MREGLSLVLIGGVIVVSLLSMGLGGVMDGSMVSLVMGGDESWWERLGLLRIDYRFPS